MNNSPLKKILHLHASAILGGTELRAFQVARGLKESFDLSILFHCKPGAICDSYQQENIPFQVAPFPRIGFALRCIREFNPNIIHIFGLKTNLLWRPLLYFLGYRNLIGHIAGLTNVGEKPSWLRIKSDVWTASFLKIYLSNSQKVADQLVSYGFPPEKLKVIHNGVEVAQAAFPRRSHVPPLILSVGALREVKGQRYLLEALKRVKARGLSFQTWFIGAGPDQASLQRFVDQNDLGAVIQFRGQLDNPTLLALFKQADLFVLLSLSEGISGAAMEAMAHGVPVLATDVGGMSELITTGVDGWLVPSRSIDQATEALVTLLSQADLRQKLGLAAYAKVYAQFNLSRTLGAYKALYDSLS